MKKTYVCARELAGLEGMPKRPAHVVRLAKLRGWQSRPRSGRGGGCEYLITDLPAETRDALLHRLIHSAPAHPALREHEPCALDHPGTHAPARPPFPPADPAARSSSLSSASGAPSNAPAAGAFLSTRGNAVTLRSGIGATSAAAASPRSTLTDRQREKEDARAALLAEVKRLGASAGMNRAIRSLVELAAAGGLPGHLQQLVPVANAKGGALSRGTIFRWLRAERENALAPAKVSRNYALADDVAQVLALFRQPNKPSLAWCAQEVARGSGAQWKPLYHRACRFRDKIPAPVLYVGRHTGAALKALQPFKRRDFLALAPNDVWVGDGHGAKLKVAHPITGSPFVPEVTVIMDVATRFVVGWSVALSENCLAVADALRHGVARHGVPLIYYSDGGAGQTANLLDAPITGTLGALGVHHEVGRPGNPQGRGVIERFWQSVLIPLARRFDTFQGRSADRDTLRLVSREIDRTLRAAKRGEVAALPAKLPAWQQFLSALEIEIAAYNQEHEHRALPRINGHAHPTPAAFRAARLQGIEIQRPAGDELATLFMPSIVRRAARGEVRLFNGIYFHRDLMLVDGEDVQVAYDIHDASCVWVKKISGELIAEARLDGNRGEYFPKPLVERLREDRAKRRMGRLQTQMDEVQAELKGDTVDAAPELAPLEIPEPEKVVALPGAAAAPRRPMFDSDAEKYRWLLDHAGEIATEDENWIGWYRSTAEYVDLFGGRPAGEGDSEAATR